jgi:hypothetical protein
MTLSPRERQVAALHLPPHPHQADGGERCLAVGELAHRLVLHPREADGGGDSPATAMYACGRSSPTSLSRPLRGADFGPHANKTRMKCAWAEAHATSDIRRLRTGPIPSLENTVQI